MIFNRKKYPKLYLVDTPIELRKLSKDSLIILCNELRNFLLESVSQSSGHLASGLGTIELTVALHYVYKTPFDYLIWDVGHQAYPHKILTGRRDLISTIRKKGGLHPFPWREESEYDVLSVGHSSTSISAGLGMAIVAEREGKGRRTVCVIGDGAITAGMAFEAMNHAGSIKVDFLVILNDNEMSISENVGALNNHLAQILSGKFYEQFKENSKIILSNLPPIKKLIKRTEENIKEIVAPKCTFFEKLGFNYIGPVDGHDILNLIQTLKNMRKMKGPQLLHIITKKGYGYGPAEKDPIKWHSVPKFNPEIGIFKKINKNIHPITVTYSTIFGNWLCSTAANDDKLTAITPAMCEGSGMTNFSIKYPTQYFDVAIAEQHAVTFAAGLAIGGYKPVVAIYSTFLQRAYDQVIHDVAIQNLPILFAIDRGGIVGSDGVTHQGAFDISYLRCIPNIVIMTPSDGNEFQLMLNTGYKYDKGPCAVRYPRRNVLFELKKLYKIQIGKGVLLRKGSNIAILNFGPLLKNLWKVANDLNTTLVDMRFVKPLDEILIYELAKTHNYIVTLEENAIIGGAGSGVNEFLMYNKLMVPVLNIGLPDYFIAQGNIEEIFFDLELDESGLFKKIKEWIKK